MLLTEINHGSPTAGHSYLSKWEGLRRSSHVGPVWIEKLPFTIELFSFTLTIVANCKCNIAHEFGKLKDASQGWNSR